MKIDEAVAALQQPGSELASGDAVPVVAPGPLAGLSPAAAAAYRARVEGLQKTHGWRRMRPELQEIAGNLFDIAWVCSPRLKAPIRCARIKHCGYVVKDAYHLPDAGNKQWSAFGCSEAADSVVAMRRKAIAANHRAFGNTLHRDMYQGQIAYVVGNGPSAKEARDWIPTRARGRRGKVVCINGAAKWFSGDMDFWASWDWLGRSHWYEDRDFTGCDALFSLYAANHCVEGAKRQGASSRNFFNGGNRNPYRKHGRGLPSAEEGLETMFSVLDVLFWLGFRTMVLFGAEHAIKPDTGDLHSGEGDARAPAIRKEIDPEHGIAQLFSETGELLYTEVNDYKGDRCWTTPDLHNGASFLVAQSMFLRDSGVEIVNCSQAGLELLFAPHVPPDRVVPLLEGYEVAGAEAEVAASVA